MPFNSDSAKQAGKKSKRGQGKTSVEIKSKIKSLLDAYNSDQMLEDLLSLKAKDRLWVLHGLSEFIVPKLQRVDIDQNITFDITDLTDAELKLLDKLSGKLTETAFSQN